MFGAGALASGRDPMLGSEMLNGGLFYDYYETGDGQYVSVGSLEPNFAMALLQALGLSDWLNKIADQRPETQSALRTAIATKFKAEDYAHWVKVFASLDACVEPVLSVNQAVEHPQFKAREMLLDAELESGEKVRQIASALPFERRESVTAGVSLGAQTIEVLNNLGYSAEQIENLKQSGCIKAVVTSK